MKKMITIALLLFAGVLNAQDSTKVWKKGAVLGLNLSQTYLQNWAAGGANSLAGTGLVSAFTNYKKSKSTWDNSIDMAFGMIKQFQQSEFNKAKWIKNDDKIELNSKYGQYAFKSWYYSGLFNFRSQFAPGYNNPLAPSDSTRSSNFLAPAYTIASIGMDYKPNDIFQLFIGPITGKTTIVNDPLLSAQGAYGVTPGEIIRNEFGGYLKASFKKDIFTNVNLKSSLELFNNYLENNGNVDLNWQVLISMKVNKYITTTLTTQLLYDDDVIITRDTNSDGINEINGPRVQFKEVFGLGLMYKL